MSKGLKGIFLFLQSHGIFGTQKFSFENKTHELFLLKSVVVKIIFPHQKCFQHKSLSLTNHGIFSSKGKPMKFFKNLFPIFLKKLSTFYKNNIFLNKALFLKPFFSNKITRFFKAKLFSPKNKPMILFLKTYFSFAFLKLIFLQNVFLESFKYFRAPLKIWHLSFF